MKEFLFVYVYTENVENEYETRPSFRQVFLKGCPGLAGKRTGDLLTIIYFFVTLLQSHSGSPFF
jgi:hypothetical protein